MESEWSIHPKNPAQGRLRPAQGTAQGTFSSLTILLLHVSISYFVVPGFWDDHKSIENRMFCKGSTWRRCILLCVFDIGASKTVCFTRIEFLKHCVLRRWIFATTYFIKYFWDSEAQIAMGVAEIGGGTTNPPSRTSSCPPGPLTAKSCLGDIYIYIWP